MDPFWIAFHVNDDVCDLGHIGMIPLLILPCKRENGAADAPAFGSRHYDYLCRKSLLKGDSKRSKEENIKELGF